MQTDAPIMTRQIRFGIYFMDFPLLRAFFSLLFAPFASPQRIWKFRHGAGISSHGNSLTDLMVISDR
jgi:hypothetical protein